MSIGNTDVNSARIRTRTQFDQGSTITNGVYSTTSDQLVRCPAKLEALTGLVQGLEIAPLLDVVAGLADAVLAIDVNVTSLVGAISCSGIDIPADLRNQLATIESNLNQLTSSVGDITQKLELINQGITDPEHIATFEEINNMVSVFSENMTLLHAAMEDLSGTQFDCSDSSGSDLSGVPTVQSVTHTIDTLISGVNVLVLRVAEIQLNMDNIKDLVVRETLSSSVELFLARINELLESLALLTQFNDLHGRLELLLNDLADLSGVHIDDLSGFADNSGFELNLLKGVFDGVVLFGDDSMDIGGPSSFYAVSSSVNGTEDPSGYFPNQPGFYNGQFSNGSTWGSLLAGNLEVGCYSYGMIGSTMSNGNAIARSDPEFFDFLLNHDIDRQFSAFLPQDIVSPRKLYVVSAGRRDLLEILAGNQTPLDLVSWPQAVVDFLIAKAQALVEQGAKVVLLATAIPMIGHFFRATPAIGSETDLLYLQESVRTGLADSVSEFNADNSGSLVVPWGVTSEHVDELFLSGDLVEGHDNLRDKYQEFGFDITALKYSNYTAEAFATVMHLYASKRAFNDLLEHRPRIKELISNI